MANWTLYRQPSGIYYARLQSTKDGKTTWRKRSLGTKRRREAEKALSVINTSLHYNDMTSSPPGDRSTSTIPHLRDVIPQYLEYSAKHHSQGYRGWAKSVAGYINKHLSRLADYRLDKITTGAVRDWQTSITDMGLKPATANRCTAILSSIYTWAEEREITHPSQRPRMPRLREERPPIRVFSDDEVARILHQSAKDGQRMALLARLGLFAG